MGRHILLGRTGCRALWCGKEYALLQEGQPLSMRPELIEGDVHLWAGGRGNDTLSNRQDACRSGTNLAQNASCGTPE